MLCGREEGGGGASSILHRSPPLPHQSPPHTPRGDKGPRPDRNRCLRGQIWGEGAAPGGGSLGGATLAHDGRGLVWLARCVITRNDGALRGMGEGRARS